MVLTPKKKHYKRIVTYIFKAEDPTDIDSQVIDLIVDIGIMQNYVLLLGSTVKFMIEHKFNLSRTTMERFCNYLDSIKGYDEDAKLFRKYWKA